MSKSLIWFSMVFALLLAARLCHVEILWAEETLPLAAAQEMRAGHVLYRDIWFDKPPVAPLLDCALGAGPEWVLRAAGALYALLCCWIAFAFARDLWGEVEGRWAATLLAFFLIFDFPSSVIPLASDLLMLAPHLAAVWMAWKQRPLWAGALAGIAFAANPKGLIVLAACVCWNASPGGVMSLLAGFTAVSGIMAAWMWTAGALPGYWDEVWRWGRVYAGTTFLEDPVRSGVQRTLSWAGFHASLVLGGVAGWKHLAGRRAPWMMWLALSAVGVAAGLRFFPRYYFLLLPAAVLLAARGFARARLPRLRAVLAIALMVPLVRFAPTYFSAAINGAWRDTAMDRDSRAVAAIVRAQARAGDTLFVWGFRPEIYVYSRLPAAARFLDSQPLTGVPADRHLTQSAPLETEGARAHRAELAGTHPAWIVDGLGVYNPRLAPAAFEDLHPWMSGYREMARSGQSVVYRRVQ